MDAGANLEPHPQNLVQYAVMGSRYSQQLLGYPRPRVAVFSIGSEDMKGNELTLETYRLLKQTDLNFVGNIDGHDLFNNVADVIVADAFVGNAVLKACESTARLVSGWLRHEIQRNPLRMLGGLLAATRSGRSSARPIPTSTAARSCSGSTASASRPTGRARPTRSRTPCAWPPSLSKDSSTSTSSRRSGEPMPNSKQHLRNPRPKHPPRSVHIVGTGSYVPDRVLTNADLEKMVDTTDEWITSRTGIRELRRWWTG